MILNSIEKWIAQLLFYITIHISIHENLIYNLYINISTNAYIRRGLEKVFKNLARSNNNFIRLLN